MAGASFSIRCESPGYPPRMQHVDKESLTTSSPGSIRAIYYVELREENSTNSSTSSSELFSKDTASESDGGDIEPDVYALAAKVQEFASVLKPPFSMIDCCEKILVSKAENPPFPASSLPDHNIIVWNKRYFEKHPTDLYNKVFILVFERLNLKSKETFKKFSLLAKEKCMSKEWYVESVERIEHQNALMAQAMLIKAAEAGLFKEPINTPYLIFDDFPTHYKFQQFMGHSQRIARRYDILTESSSCSYIGSFPLAAQSLSDEQRKIIHGLFSLKRKMMEENEEGYETRLLLGCNIVYLEDCAKAASSFEFKAISSIFSDVELSKLRKIGQTYLYPSVS